jgi:fatty-acyl-CoA synthase
VDDSTPLARHPTVKAAWQLPAAYGTTETLTINTAFPSSTPAEIRSTSHGEPLPGNTLKIVDPLTGVVVPRGQRGEIAVKGPTLMLGYLGIPADESFDADGFFHTGDGGYVDEVGRLFWEGRLTDIIKTGGANVAPLEIDAALETHPGVRLVRTVGVPHETLGEMVVACIVPHDGVALDETSIREFAKERLASYKVPRRVLFLRDDELSMTGNEKVKADALRQLATKRLGAARGADT